MDKVAIHYYSEYQNPEKVEQNIEQVKVVIVNNEAKEKTILITEFGLPTGGNKDGGGERRAIRKNRCGLKRS